jgi:hypothetical protein
MAPSRCPLVVKGQTDQQPMMLAEAAPQRLAHLGELLAQLALGQLRQRLGSRSPATRASSIARPDTPSTSVATETLLDAGVRQGLLDALALGAMGLDQPLAVADKVAQLADCRWRHEAAAQQPTLGAAHTTRRHHRRRSCGRAGSWTWQALTSSSCNPRSSSTYQQGFQYCPVASITTWVTPSACSQSASASRLE